MAAAIPEEILLHWQTMLLFIPACIQELGSISKSLVYFFDFISKHNASIFLGDIDGKYTLIYVCVKIEFHHINLCFPHIFLTLLNVSMW